MLDSPLSLSLSLSLSFFRLQNHLRFVIGVEDIGVAAEAAREKRGKSACTRQSTKKLQCGKVICSVGN